MGPDMSDTSAGTQTEGPQRADGPRAPLLTAAVIVLTLLVALGAWLAYSAFNRQLATPADPTELAALDARLTRILGVARPIAASFAAEPATGAIDVGAYRAKVADLQALVDSTNDLAATSPDALEVRDLILTGGSQVVAGMQSALDAAVANDAGAATGAAEKVDEGLANLADARAKLDVLLGKVKAAVGVHDGALARPYAG